MEILTKYFDQPLTVEQNMAFTQLESIYRDWNEKINLISRKDIHNFNAHHLLHALAISKIFNFHVGAQILDLGTGGGLPGIPLAIRYPEVNFTLIDGKRKKIMVVQDIIERLGLKNATAQHIRAEEIKSKFDFVVCRAVASLEKIYGWSERIIKEEQMHAIPNGLICLKGGNIKEELEALPRDAYYEVFPLANFFDMPYYEEKYVIYTQL